LLYLWERHLMLFPTLGPSKLPIVVAQPNERHVNRKASDWSGMANTELGTTSGSNEEVVVLQ